MSRNYGGKGKVKTLPTVTPMVKKTAAMPKPTQAGKQVAGKSKGKEGSCGK
jgi:uncharacterized low-complexity protein